MFSCCSNQTKSTTSELNLNAPLPMGSEVVPPSRSRDLSPEERSHYSIRPSLNSPQPTKEEFSSTLKKYFQKTPGRESDSATTRPSEPSPLDVALNILSKYYDGDSEKYKELVNSLKEKERESEMLRSLGKEKIKVNSVPSFDVSSIKPIDPGSALRYTYESDFLKSQERNIENNKKGTQALASPPLSPKAQEFYEAQMSFGPEEDVGISPTTFLAKGNMLEPESKPSFEMRELQQKSLAQSQLLVGSQPQPQPQPQQQQQQNQQTPVGTSTPTTNSLYQSQTNLQQILNLKTVPSQDVSGKPMHEIVGSPEWIASLQSTINKMKIPAVINPVPTHTPAYTQTPNPERVSVSAISREVQTDVVNSLNTSQKDIAIDAREPSPERLETPLKEKQEPFKSRESEIKVVEGEFFQRDTDMSLGDNRLDTEESQKRSQHPKKERIHSEEFPLEEKEQKNEEVINQSPQGSPKKLGITEASLMTPQFKMYSNENLLEVEHLISPDVRSLIFQKPDMVILEGELLKYKPGIQHTYIKRWARITAKHFQYFKTRWGANCWDDKPLFSIAFSDLRAAYRVNVKLPKGAKIEVKSPTANKKGPKFPNELFHLELFPINIEVPYDEENALLRNVVKKEDIPTIGGDISRIDHNGSKIYTPTKNTIQILNIKEDHLMPSPAKEKNEKSSYSARKSEKKNTSSLSGKDLVTGFRPSIKANAGSVEDVFNELNQTAAKLNTSNERRSRLSVTTLTNVEGRERSPTDKKNAAYTWVKSTEDLSSWSGREKEWYYSEKRLLFASNSQKEREIWLSVLTWLICEYNQR